MLSREQFPQGPPIYITANSLMSKNKTREDALQIARDAGADGFELRRELLTPGRQPFEIEGLRSQLECFRSPPIYSTPLPLFTEGGFREEIIGQVLAEAYALGCGIVKFSPGKMEFVEGKFMTSLSSLHNNFPDLTLTVENDQNPANGDVAMWVRFFEQATAWNCPIWMTFDLGNWSCVGSNAIEAAQNLASYVVYIHAKAVEHKGDTCVSQPIHIASMRHPALAHLSTDIPRAIEFPILAQDGDTLTATLHTYITWLRSGNFAT
ncbi:MAG: sugar phosphate isomerase/epimerase [Ktedonobacteraceae bacterium]